MELISIEKSKLLAQKNGWSLEYSEGYVDGESFRKRGKQPSQFPLVGVDDYSAGFRAGYFERKNSGLASTNQSSAAANTETPSGQVVYL